MIELIGLTNVSHFFLRIGFSAILLMCFTGCAHRYYYLPELKGERIMQAKKGGIAYTIPTEGTGELIMRVRSLGVSERNKIHMLGVRLSFGRPEGFTKVPTLSQEFFDPTEQIVLLGGGIQLSAALVRSKNNGNPIIGLNDSVHEVVELLFPLPKDHEDAGDVESFLFQWKIHYGQGKVERQTAYFDRYVATSEQALEFYSPDPDHPEDEKPLLELPGWQVIKWPLGWPLNPWWPWK